MTTRLRITSRSDLRPCCGVNTHFCFNPSVYAKGSEPNPDIIQSLIDLKVGYVRERWWPANVAQRKAFTALTDAGIGLYLFIGTVNSTQAEVQSDASALVSSPFADSVVGICGPNEPNNGGGGANWASKVVNVQREIFTAVSNQKRVKSAAIVGPVLKHNVKNLDADYNALAAAGVGRWCDTGDFHFYPGNAGPSGNAGEAKRAAQAYGALSLFQSETGWTGADTDPETAARFSVEAYLRNYLTGMVGTSLYEFCDEAPYVKGREGMFGMVKTSGSKPAYLAVQKVLATPDGDEEFVGSLGDFSSGVPSDAQAIVTSEGGGKWTVYLLRGSQKTATLILPPQYASDLGTASVGADGQRRFKVQLTETMTTLQVKPSIQSVFVRGSAPSKQPALALSGS